MLKNIHFIINPGAAKKEPLLSLIHEVFKDSAITWDISITKKGNDIHGIASSLIGKTDLIAVYGGDGCVMELAQVLGKTETALAIIPAGTANVMAKELGIPLDTKEALELLANPESRLIKIDMGTINYRPFLIRVNLGVMADMILNADRSLKDQLGQFAYGITAISSLSEAKPVVYSMTIDGEKIQEEGISLTVTNSGNIGLSGFNMLPGISVTDGMLDVVLMNQAGLLDILKVAGSTLFQTESGVLKHWKCREVIIHMETEHRFICDDREMNGKDLEISVLPRALKVLVPALTAAEIEGKDQSTVSSNMNTPDTDAERVDNPVNA